MPSHYSRPFATPMRRDSRALATTLLATSLLSGCLFNSQWFQQKSAQRNVAQQQTPRTLQATPAESSESPSMALHHDARVLRVRVLATPRHAAELVEWRRQFAQLIDDANRILEPTLSARWEIAEVRIWNAQHADDALDPLLIELRETDPGNDVDLVVGLVGSTPRFERNFHELGRGAVLGKHLVVRAVNDGREREAMEIELSRLDGEERDVLYAKRKRHKTTTVFLHELGHTLGLIHEVDTSSIMTTHYDKSMTAFSPVGADIMRMVLDHRRSPGEDELAFREHLAGEFDRTKSNWVAADRDAFVATLRPTPAPWLAQAVATSPTPATGATPAPVTSATQTPQTGPDALQDVSAPDRALYAQALDAEHAGDARGAWTKAKPLFARYLDVYVIQDLRCRLATMQGVSWAETRKECERLMDLTGAQYKPK
jgi:hypothetical protein